MKKRCNILCAFLLLSLYVAYQVSISAFAHAHIINGVTIVHSHPSKDLQHHNHSSEQIVDIALLSTVQTEEASIDSFELAAPIVLGVLEFCTNTFRAITSHEHAILLRGPPAL